MYQYLWILYVCTVSQYGCVQAWNVLIWKILLFGVLSLKFVPSTLYKKPIWASLFCKLFTWDHLKKRKKKVSFHGHTHFSARRPLKFIFSFLFDRVVHAKEGGGPAMDISFPLNKGWEGWDTVAYKVVRLAQDVQVKLSHIWINADHLYLHIEKVKMTLWTG